MPRSLKVLKLSGEILKHATGALFVESTVSLSVTYEFVLSINVYCIYSHTILPRTAML